MRRTRILLWGAVLTTALSAASGQVLPDQILAIVNGNVITTEQVNDAVRAAVDSLRRLATSQEDFNKRIDKLSTDKLNDLIDEQLILFDFKESGFQLPEPLVDDVINERIKLKYGNRETLIATLQAQGLTFESFRKQQREQIIVESLRQKMISSEKVLISPNKIQRYYTEHLNDFKLEDQVKLRMIALNATTANPMEEIRKLGAEILMKIDQGVPFSQMATVYSEGPDRARGGDRNWVEKASLRKELADAAFGLKAGQHSGLIEIENACYILMVEDSRIAHVRPLTDATVRDGIEEILKREERNRLQKKWMDRVKKKAYVQYF
jgi:parvulin-like peptidyl-prolyl isomerase